MKRIMAFARESRNNNLNEWIRYTDGYYFKNSIYRIFALLSIFKLMQEELTLVDMNQDLGIRDQYIIIKSISHSLSHDFKFANTEPKIPYDPHSISPSNIADKTAGRTQGIVQGELDQIVDIFIVQENANNSIRKRLMSYGEFENSYREIKKSGKLDMAIELFSDFHPAKKPILWRILIAQAILYNSILTINNKVKDKSDISNHVIDYSYDEKLRYFDWRIEEEKILISEEKVLEPFTAANNYFKEVNLLDKLINHQA